MNGYRFWFEPPPGASSPLCGRLSEESISGTLAEYTKLRDWVDYLKETGKFDLAVGYVRYDGGYLFHGANRETLEKYNFGKLSKNSLSVNGPKFCLHRISLSRSDYIKAVMRAQGYIAAGDIYQVNICRVTSGHVDLGALDLWKRLLRISPAPHAAYVEFPEVKIVSASPELFLHIYGRKITTMPIKGTRRRSPSLLEDKKLREELASDSKEHAELLMITDLERNDLGQFCDFGSIRVERLAEQREFSYVRHLVSTISGRLRREVSHSEALLGCLPGGSISGAPKHRALQIISELEPEPRGIYTGVIGWFDLRKEESCFSIAIRTIEIKEDGSFRYGVGSGITAASIPEKEWEETCWKEAALLQALGASQSELTFE